MVYIVDIYRIIYSLAIFNNGERVKLKLMFLTIFLFLFFSYLITLCAQVAEKTSLLRPVELKLVPMALEGSAFRTKFLDTDELLSYTSWFAVRNSFSFTFSCPYNSLKHKLYMDTCFLNPELLCSFYYLKNPTHQFKHSSSRFCVQKSIPISSNFILITKPCCSFFSFDG